MHYKTSQYEKFANPAACAVLLKRTFCAFAFGMLFVLTAVPFQSAQAASNAKTAKSPEWIYPVIPGFGGVHPRSDVAVRPDPKENYKIFVDVISNERDPAGKFNALNRLARLVNLMGYAKVPHNHVHIVALLDEKVGYASGTNAFYRKTFGGDNPNLPLIHALKKAGVELLVCSQGLAGNNIPDSAIDPDVTITLSALTDMVVYGQKGYVYMRL